MQQEINIYNFEDYFSFLLAEKQNDEKLLQKVHNEHKQFSVKRIKQQIKDDFTGFFLEEIFQYKRYKRYQEYSDKFTKKQSEYHLKYIEYIEYMHDEALNNFIRYVLTIYPVFFAGIQPTKDKPNPITIDKSLKYLFLNNIAMKNYETAVKMLQEKQRYHDENDELMKILNSLYNEISLSDIDDMLRKDIESNVDKNKVNIMKLKAYLKKEILLRIASKQKTNNKVFDIVKKEDKLVLSELEQALEDHKNMEDFWDSF